MALKRSRRATEVRFQNAVLELVAESGFAHLGINAVAEQAKSDKVLIYRYFGSLDGLLEKAAESHSWLPSAEELCHQLPDEPKRLLEALARKVCRHLQTNRVAGQLSIWRHVVTNPLTAAFTNEWRTLWQEVSERIGTNLGYEAGKNWQNACALLALSVEAELSENPIDPKAWDLLRDKLVTPYKIAAHPKETEDPDILPTNLL